MLKIAFITTGLDTGGAEVFLIDLLKSLKASGIDPLVVSLTGKGFHYDDVVELGVPVVALEGYSPLMLPLLKYRALQEVRRFGPDLVQGWMYHGNYIASDAGACLGVPVAWSVHHSLSGLRQEKKTLRLLIHLLRKRSGKATFVQYCSHDSKYHHERIGFATYNSRVIPNGFDCDKFAPDPAQRAVVRRQLGLAEEHFAIALIARYHPVKDHANLLHAAKRALAADDRFRYYLIGDQVDDDNAELVALRRELGLEHAVHFLGLRKDVDRLMPGFDLVTTSSAWGEAFPIVLGEAMACGIPCTATDLGDCAYLIDDTGRVVPPGDPAALADAWLELKQEAPEARQERCRAARRRIVENFSIDTVSARFKALYEEALHTAGPLVTKRLPATQQR